MTYKVKQNQSLAGHGRVSLFMSTEGFSVSEEVWRYGDGQLLADVGGVLGLLLGYSILSAYEFLIDSVFRRKENETRIKPST